MSRRWMTLVCLAALVCAMPALAEHHEEGPGNLARVTFWTAADDGFEAGVAAHNEFHVAKNDPVPHFTWQIVTGKRAGTYARTSFGHDWSDFDVDPEFAAADEADSSETLDPHIGSASPQIWEELSDVSRFDGDGPKAIAQLTYFHVKPGHSGGFMRAIGAVTAAADETDWPEEWIWYTVVDGGRTPTFVLVLPSDDWAGMAEPQPSFPEMIIAAEGEEGFAKIVGVFADTIESQWVETSVLRTDLSYIPSSGDGDGDM